MDKWKIFGLILLVVLFGEVFYVLNNIFCLNTYFSFIFLVVVISYLSFGIFFPRQYANSIGKIGIIRLYDSEKRVKIGAWFTLLFFILVATFIILFKNYIK